MQSRFLVITLLLSLTTAACQPIGVARSKGDNPPPRTDPGPIEPERDSKPVPPSPPEPTVPVEECGAQGLADADKVVAMPGASRPPAGEWFTDPAFGTPMIRVSDQSEKNDFDVNIYSQLQPFSADGALLLTTSPSGLIVRSMPDLAVVTEGLALNGPRWHPTQPDLLLHLGQPGTLHIGAVDVRSGAEQTLFEDTAYTGALNNPSFEELSHDGRWLAAVATHSGGADIVAIDLDSKVLGARIGIEGLYQGVCPVDPQWGVVDPDWVGVSPLGTWLVVQWPTDGSGRCAGMEAFDIQTGAFAGQVSTGRQHGDLGLVADWQSAPVHQREVLVTFEIAQDGSAVTRRFLPGSPTGPTPGKVLLTLPWGNSDHISCQGPAGACLVSAGPGQWTDEATPGWQPFENEIFVVDFDGGVTRVVHHRSSECGYWAQPRASWSRDGRWVVFSSDWGVDPCAVWDDGEADAYIADLSPDCE